ncbi:MAG TPA: aspartate kinase [Phycisphaerales bacterium]|nr:aspartate kinase [Phycisphaerales bacterium]HCD31891.1 aspartate kinase [Phycisphaerales bacterium]|tara:strand:+ start:38819 stop:40135 length:1317 start_codon:yes stop_codon:yes gene_type:complete
MGIKVCKFGGSSLADAAQIKKAQSIIQADADRKFVVPSAPGKRNKEDQKITDLLYLCHAHAQQGIAFDEVFGLIADRYNGIVKELGLTLDMTPHLDKVKADITAGASSDYAASRGEFLNGPIIAALLGYTFIDPAQFIFFDDKGKFDAEKTQTVLSKKLASVESAVVPGFFGSLPNGDIKTFSRGGSDITGAIVARAANADVYENWTDVSGLLKTDPRIVDNPETISTITYKELRELAYMGASVMHEEAIFPVRIAGIPINIRNTNAPDDDGTMIVSDDDTSSKAQSITGIAGRKDFTVIYVEKALMNSEIGFGRKLLEVLEDNQVSFEHMPSGIDTTSLVVSNSNLQGKLDDVLAGIKHVCKPDKISVFENMALIATVGRGMSHHVGVSAKLFTALSNANVNIRMIDQGSSEMNIIVGVEGSDFEKAIKAIYAEFVG